MSGRDLSGLNRSDAPLRLTKTQIMEPTKRQKLEIDR